MRVLSVLLVVVAVLACAERRDARSDVTPPPTEQGQQGQQVQETVIVEPQPRVTQSEGPAQLGEVCRVGRPTGDGAALTRECEEGLSCCYPCGMAGCDWVCSTAEECALKRP
ncbi:MAG: hypothetical protein KC457_16640 [Myxococcales bacterium]|nr:hypothetical protein [Myxococcales bacterium]